jgi:mannan endo-1,4-beta-mannosidase
MCRVRGVFVSTLLLVAVTSCFSPQALPERQEPVNRKASTKTRQVLRLLYELPNRPDHKVISGQVLRTLDHNPNYLEGDPRQFSSHPDVYDRIQTIHDQTGYWVGIAGAEYSDWTKAYRTQNQQILSAELNPYLIGHSKRGGIVELHWHPLSPKNGTGSTEVIHHDADELLKPGPIHDNWMRLLNDAAAGLRELRDNDVVVLWRPMHGNNLQWWWSTLGQEGYRRVWAHMVDYFSNTCELDNILYFQSWYDVEGSGRKYAGGDLVDIVGLDAFPHKPSLGLWNSLLAFGKPIAVSEGWLPEGTVPGSFDTRAIIAGIKRWAPRITFFVQFDHPRYPNHHLAAHLFARELLSDPWIVNAPLFDPLHRK